MKKFKKLTREDLKTVKAGQVEKIEANYCKTPVYSGDDATHLAGK